MTRAAHPDTRSAPIQAEISRVEPAWPTKLGKQWPPICPCQPGEMDRQSCPAGMVKRLPNEPRRPFLSFVASKRLANHAVVFVAGAVRCLYRLYWTIWLNRSAGRACGWPVRFMEKHRMLRVMTPPAIMATAAVLVACGGVVATSVPGTSAPPPPLPRGDSRHNWKVTAPM